MPYQRIVFENGRRVWFSKRQAPRKQGVIRGRPFRVKLFSAGKLLVKRGGRLCNFVLHSFMMLTMKTTQHVLDPGRCRRMRGTPFSGEVDETRIQGIQGVQQSFFANAYLAHREKRP
jgi:hypothetical protein